MPVKAVIMAGGKGTRLYSVNKTIPKPMFPVNGKPILEYQIESLKKSGIQEITMIVGHLGNIIKGYFRDGSEWGMDIGYITEEAPLGSAGSLYYLNGKADDDFLLIYGDLLLDVDFKRFMDFHKTHGGDITLFGHPNSHPFDSDLISADENGRVTEILPKHELRGYYHNFVNAGLYCISPALVSGFTKPVRVDLEQDVIINKVSSGKVYAYKSSEYVKDMGTPDRLESVIRDINNGIVAARNLQKKQKAVFLDRDGTINRLAGFLKAAEEFELLPDVAEAIKRLNGSEYLTIVATNQPVIARGDCSREELEKIHMKMETELGKQGAYIDALFYCPHHPDKGFDGEVESLKINCGCRKPKTGMLVQAAEKYNIDLTHSWFIGDSTVDVQTGINAGMKTILLMTGEAGRDRKYDVRPDHKARDLEDGINRILGEVPCQSAGPHINQNELVRAAVQRY